MESSQTRTNRKNFTQIAGMRGIVASLTAYLLHYNLLFGTGADLGEFFTPALGTIAKYWFYASYPFFWLSGFLMFYVYEKRLSAHELTFKRYMLPKVKKLFPIMIVTAVLVFVLEWAGKLVFGEFPLHADGGDLRYSPLSLFLSCVGLQCGFLSDGDAMAVNGPSWFTSVLLVCYVLYYLIATHVRRERVRNLIYGGMVVLGILLLLHPLEFPFLYFCNGRGYFGFFLGVLMAKITLPNAGNLPASKEQEAGSIPEEALPDKDALSEKRVVGLIVSVVVLAAGILALYFELPVNVEVWVNGVIWVPALYLTIYGRVLRRFCSLKPVVWLGGMAMPIFLCDIPTKLVIRMADIGLGLSLDYSRPWVWLGHIALSLLVAWVFHLIFEKGSRQK